MKISHAMPSVGVGIGGLLLWEGICRFFKVPAYLLPTPSQIFAEIIYNFSSLATHTAVTVSEALLGFLIANVCAIALSVCMLYIRHLDRAIMPFAIALKTTPIVAMAPLLLIWFGTGMAPKVAAAALICFFPALVNSLKGFNALEEGEEDLFRIYGASKTQMLLKLRFQRAAPYIFSALKVSSSLSIVGAIVGEFVGANKGIGYVILVASYHFEFARMFAALFMSAIAGVVFYAAISYFDRKYVFWLVGPVVEIRLDSPPPR
ncbi:MAG TPA: ABC transporter permease [Chthoniobacterales bacterium]|nr:ABC transporter permease [Chthoniobacterales bacterium]